jgi:phospholipid/cholesterol/gamma-HCH transport system permease protein
MKLPLQTFAWLAAMVLASAEAWAKPDQVTNHVKTTVEGLRRMSIGILEWFGGIAEFCGRLVRAAVKPPYEGRELVRQMDEVGAKSLPLVMLAGAAIGVVLSLHTRDSFTQFGAESMLPTLIILSLVKETGPIITALVVSGRVGAGIGAELGSMKVTEQIDAIEASAVNPYKFLAATRVLACMFMLPLLTIVADFCGIITGWIANALVEPITLKLFLTQGLKDAAFADLLPSTFKTVIFGFIIGMVGCFQGMRARGGTAGVGRAATSAVVLSSLFVILADVVLVRLIVTFYPQ